MFLGKKGKGRRSGPILPHPQNLHHLQILNARRRRKTKRRKRRRRRAKNEFGIPNVAVVKHVFYYH